MPIQQEPMDNRRGATFVLVIVLIILFMMTAAFAVDGTYMHLVRAELRTATDAAAQAAAQQLSDEIRSSTIASGTLNTAAVIARAQQVALANSVAGQGLQLDSSDIQLGRATRTGGGKYSFVDNALPFNSVRVVGKRTGGSLSGNVGLFFGRAFGVSHFEPQEVSIGTFMQRNIVLVLDRSGSMKFDESGNTLYSHLIPDVGPESRITKMKQSLADFLLFLQASSTTEKVGVVSFASDVRMDQVLTESLPAIESAYAPLIPDGMTNVAGGILEGVALMNLDPQSRFVEKTLVVLTDGQENVGSDGVYYGDGLVPAWLNAESAAAFAASQDLKIFTITYCVDSSYGRSVMENVASIGGGKSYHAADQAALNNAFADIALMMSTMFTE